MGDILASAVTRAEDGVPLQAVAQVLGRQGYEPHVEGKGVVLANCPFDALAHKHAALVCGLDRDFVQGVAEGLGCPQVRALLEPQPGMCCVTARAAG